MARERWNGLTPADIAEHVELAEREFLEAFNRTTDHGPVEIEDEAIIGDGLVPASGLVELDHVWVGAVGVDADLQVWDTAGQTGNQWTVVDWSVTPTAGQVAALPMSGLLRFHTDDAGEELFFTYRGIIGCFGAATQAQLWAAGVRHQAAIEVIEAAGISWDAVVGEGITGYALMYPHHSTGKLMIADPSSTITSPGYDYPDKLATCVVVGTYSTDAAVRAHTQVILTGLSGLPMNPIQDLYCGRNGKVTYGNSSTAYPDPSSDAGANRLQGTDWLQPIGKPVSATTAVLSVTGKRTTERRS